MSPSRRDLLRSAGLALVGLSGCSAGYRSVPDPDPRDCPDGPRLPESEPHPDDAELPSVPEPPASLDAAAVTSYVYGYELAWAWREATTVSSGPVEEVSVDADFQVRNRSDDAAVLQSYVFPHGRVHFESTDSDSPGYFDGPGYTAAYLVTSAGAWRTSETQNDRGGTPAPLEPHRQGQLVHCF